VDESSGTEVPHQTVFTHLGWRQTAEGWAFLHGGGAVGAEGLEVDLDHELQRYALPTDPGDVAAAVKVSLDFLDLGDARVTFPLWGAVWRVLVCEWLPCLVVPWTLGETGLFKSTMVALALSHFGGPFSKDTLPASWLDTDNRLEQRTFIAKDVLLPVDDFCPEKHANNARDMQRRASRLIRAVGNRQGRGRLRADLSARPTYMPRGLVVSTAEQLPQLATSALARILPIPFEAGGIDEDSLSALQTQATILPTALRGLVEHLWPQADELGPRLLARFEDLRTKARVEGHHRLPESVAHLFIGLELGMGFAVHIGALEEGRGAERLAQGWEVLLGLARAHAVTLGEERPARLFLEGVAEDLAAVLPDGVTALRALGELGRAFRSVAQMHQTLQVWEAQGIGFVSAREGFDTRTALGRLLLNLLASLTEFELEVLSERVKAGMDRARRQGVHIGRPPVTARPGFAERWAAVEPEIRAGRLSKSQAARQLGIGFATVLRPLEPVKRGAAS